MRQTQIFSGSSHPRLVEDICDLLGQKPGDATLGKFSNGETSVRIQTSIRNQDVFIVQSGSQKINDSVMELLIMISACKGGSARSITAVLPYFPYSRQSKKKSHRGAITARMLANLLHIAGVNHVMTMDLHASQMQGFFKCPVDNLVAEPLIARWIKQNVAEWNQAVVVSKNPGGTKRVTSLADALKLSFGIVTTDRRRFNTSMWTDQSMTGSFMLERLVDGEDGQDDEKDEEQPRSNPMSPPVLPLYAPDRKPEGAINARRPPARMPGTPSRMHANRDSDVPSSPLAKSTLPSSSHSSACPSPLMRSQTAPATGTNSPPSDHEEEFIDESIVTNIPNLQRARDVIHGRFIHGHIVDDDDPSPAFSATSHSNTPSRHRALSDLRDDDPIPDHMISSTLSVASSIYPRERDPHGLGGSGDAEASSEEEEDELRNPELETTITLVGNVRDRPVFIVDDIMDKAASWVAAAETCVKRGGATRVYCIATHGIFGDESLEEIEACECIDKVVVTNTFPITEERARRCKKLVQLDVSRLLAEAIRRNKHGESMSRLYMHYD
ncbi:phosphoribosyl pyrophosphokinase [Eremomyces bilateralis CBS 781.70]|uniref:Ribose-phosphate pyrophosphokinase 1 n=1 Tax=Eremomyces bilateralis CBS 781.70 TaxID=1392243 RepID=A0A6G1G0T1_9PEZI|nr:phosphoribosyl pyrophosphokinase [Eremomyces bilateralis CBS 781.70]KAF1811664.1 phosphoribosyl pyrophosphokinase [Eremomyces bilateralis CBS 781.70]